MSFWDDEKCEYCGGNIIEKNIDWPKRVGKKYFLFKNVPAGICEICGTRNLSANTLKIMEQKVKRKKEFKKILQMPVLQL